MVVKNGKMLSNKMMTARAGDFMSRTSSIPAMQHVPRRGTT